MEKIFKKENIIFFIILIIVGILLTGKYFKDEEEIGKIEEFELVEENTDEISQANEEVRINQDIIVHVAGAVRKPGIVLLKTGDRVIDAIELAGGFLEEAETSSVNLARKVDDEEKIWVSKIGENIEEDLTNDMTTEDKLCIIDINTCSKDELLSLPGIGNVTADRILEYRESNKFSVIEDIMNVSGIGVKKFDAIKEMIRIK